MSGDPHRSGFKLHTAVLSVFIIIIIIKKALIIAVLFSSSIVITLLLALCSFIQLISRTYLKITFSINVSAYQIYPK